MHCLYIYFFNLTDLIGDVVIFFEQFLINSNWNIIQHSENMIEEQLQEVTKKIKQIECQISRRKQRAIEWSLNYKKVLQEKENKQYLQKCCNSRINFKSLSPDDHQKIQKQLNRKVMGSRGKIKGFYNQLKELDLLQKERNRIRRVILERRTEKEREGKENCGIAMADNDKNKGKSKFRAISENQKIQSNQKNQTFCRTSKDRCNPFSQIKADKFIELSLQKKQNLGPQLMKYFCVGIESTPIGQKLKTQQKKQELYSKSQTTKYLKNRMNKTSFAKDFKTTFEKKQDIFGMNYEPRNIFEDRMRKIIKYHGDFWGKEFVIQP